jgi:hypothetical protein
MNMKSRSRYHVDQYDASEIVSNIGSFLTLSEIPSMGPEDYSSNSSLALAFSPQSSMLTGLAIENASGAEKHAVDWMDDEEDLGVDLPAHSPRRRRQGSWTQEILVCAIFSHPRPLSQYCLDVYEAAREVQQRQSRIESLFTGGGDRSTTDIVVVPQSESTIEKIMRPITVVCHGFFNQVLFKNIPLAVVLDLLEGFRELGLDSSFAVVTLSTRAMQKVLDVYIEFVFLGWDALGRAAHAPLLLMQVIVSHPPPFNEVVGKTTEAVVSGIQSVATGVGSASSFLKFQRLSSKAVQSSTASIMSASNSGSFSATSLFRRSRSSAAELNKKKQQQSKSAVALNQKLLRRLSSLNSAASVISYRELDDDTAGLSKQAKTRVQRMMHYDVSLRPFVATVQVQSRPNMELEIQKQQGNRVRQSDSVLVGDSTDGKGWPLVSSTTGGTISSFGDIDPSTESQAGDFPLVPSTLSPAYNSSTSTLVTWGGNNASRGNNEENDSVSSPFMCTPQSFPPTPVSRRMVLARGTRFADDVVFLARDQLRVHDGLASDNERTREMAMALTQGKRLAVFDADDAIAAGIDLTCGQHVVTKVGTMLYCSTRSMVPVLRNCFVYFEMTVLPRSTAPNQSAARSSVNSAGPSMASGSSIATRSLMPPSSMATLSIGLSTKEMPLNTLVGAWKGSVGLYSTGQFLTAGQWCSPIDPASCAYGERATVGCLVCLDDATAFETWDGVMVTAAVTFSVNGRIVSPPVTTVPALGSAGMMPSSSTSNPQGHTPATPLGGQTTPEKTKVSLGSSPFTGPSFTAPRVFQQSPPSLAFTLPLLVPAEEELYPTVTLHSPATAVMSRFSAGDLLATSRSQMGAPEGVTIYAVDGSVVFE